MIGMNAVQTADLQTAGLQIGEKVLLPMEDHHQAALQQEEEAALPEQEATGHHHHQKIVMAEEATVAATHHHEATHQAVGAKKAALQADNTQINSANKK
jgi:hypothetical protein